MTSWCRYRFAEHKHRLRRRRRCFVGSRERYREVTTEHSRIELSSVVQYNITYHRRTITTTTTSPISTTARASERVSEYLAIATNLVVLYRSTCIQSSTASSSRTRPWMQRSIVRWIDRDCARFHDPPLSRCERYRDCQWYEDEVDAVGTYGIAVSTNLECSRLLDVRDRLLMVCDVDPRVIGNQMKVVWIHNQDVDLDW